jgi:hypothetical protein
MNSSAFSMTSRHHLLLSKHGIFVDLCSHEKICIKLSPDGTQEVCFLPIKIQEFQKQTPKQLVKKTFMNIGSWTFW